MFGAKCDARCVLLRIGLCRLDIAVQCWVVSVACGDCSGEAMLG